MKHYFIGFLFLLLGVLGCGMSGRAAAWNANVRFDVNGGQDLNVNAKSVPVGQPYGELPKPFRAGHKFTGWNTKPSGKGVYITADTVCTTEDEHILYAVWVTPKGKTAKAKPTLTMRQGRVAERTDGRLKLRFQKVAKASGYKVRFSTTKKFKKGTYETLTLNKNDNIIFIYGVPPYKTYYVKVKAFQNRSGKKVYGRWSKVKKFTTTVR